MSALIIGFKVILALLVIYRIYRIISFVRSDKHVKFSFDLVSLIEVDGAIGITLVALLSAVNETSYGFTIGLLLVAILLNVLHIYRVILSGDRRILVGNRNLALKDIRGISSGYITLLVYPKQGNTIKVIVPLTQNEVLRKMKYLK